MLEPLKPAISSVSSLAIVQASMGKLLPVVGSRVKRAFSKFWPRSFERQVAALPAEVPATKMELLLLP